MPEIQEIQEQVEEYAKEQLDFPDEQLPGLYALLHKFVEEFCKATCSLCRGENHGYHDSPEKHNEMNTLVHWSNTEMPGWLVCHANDIRRHFAWLKK